jgi:hypothetical protein
MFYHFSPNIPRVTNIYHTIHIHPPCFTTCSHPIRCPIAQGTGLEADLPMLRVPEKVTNVGILMITGQRGRLGDLIGRGR